MSNLEKMNDQLNCRRFRNGRGQRVLMNTRDDAEEALSHKCGSSVIQLIDVSICKPSTSSGRTDKGFTVYGEPIEP
jgi:hypothetical protein